LPHCSEFCAVIWDFEHEYFVQSSFGEAACSLGWLPVHAFLFAVGTSMGWVKVYDTRISNQQVRCVLNPLYIYYNVY
jgi:hypothetical protein